MRRIQIKNTTAYRYEEQVTLLPHTLQLVAPADHDQRRVRHFWSPGAVTTHPGTLIALLMHHCRTCRIHAVTKRTVSDQTRYQPSQSAHRPRSAKPFDKQ
jgi:hypothetical protein